MQKIIFMSIVIHTAQMLPNNKMNIASQPSLTTLKKFARAENDRIGQIICDANTPSNNFH